MYAGFWNRFAAAFLDGLVILVVEIVLLTVLPSSGVMAVILPILILVMVWLYEALLVSSPRQATLGKMAVGIKVTDLAGERIGFGREAAHIDSGEPLRAEGLSLAIKAALTDAGCAMHDMDFRITDLSGEQAQRAMVSRRGRRLLESERRSDSSRGTSRGSGGV